MSETTLVGQLGMLAKQRREEIGLNRAALAKEAGIESEQTIHAFEFGRALPSVDTQRKLEKALDWRLGVIEKVMAGSRADALTMEELDAEDSLYLAANGGIRSMALIPDDALLAEVARRMAQPSQDESRNWE